MTGYYGGFDEFGHDDITAEQAQWEAEQRAESEAAERVTYEDDGAEFDAREADDRDGYDPAEPWMDGDV